MKSMMRKTTVREIKNSFGRYMAILSIIALGVGFFAGIRVTKPAMIKTADDYLKAQELFDFRLISTIGFEEEEVEALGGQPDVVVAAGAIFTDLLYVNESGEESVLRAHSITESVNVPDVKSGRMPEAADECVLDSTYFDETMIGKQITVSQNNTEDTRDMFAYSEYTVVGLVQSPYYLNFERGNTSLGNGKLTGFVYLPEAGFNSEYYTEVFLRFDHDYQILSKDYEDYVDGKKDALEAFTRDKVDERYQSILADANQEIADAKQELTDKEAEANEELEQAKSDLEDAEAEVEKNERDLNIAERDLKAGKAEAEAGLLAIAEQREALGEYAVMYEEEFLAQETMIQETLNYLDTQMAEVAKGKKKIAEAKQEIADGWVEYEEGLETLTAEVADGWDKIEEAEIELSKIEELDVYVLGRNTNIGYVLFGNDTDIVEAISVVFPVFFFLIAALVCITTMNRMAEEQRTQIGILKALGYSRNTIMKKYMIYSGSAALIGGVLGYLGGTYVFPYVIWQAYRIMYGFADIEYLFHVPLAIISLFVALLCSMGSTYFSCRQELRSVTAELIRPKAPKNGKRIFLERVTFLWKHLKFLHKVSIRNLFRYKKRFFMMVVGISGCTALLVAGFGIKDSIAKVVDKQYQEIQTYDMSVTLTKSLNQSGRAEFEEAVSGYLSNFMFAMEEAVDLEYNGSIRSVTLVIPENPEEVGSFINLHTEDKEQIPFPQQGEVVITQKAAQKLKVSVGDTIIVRDSDLNEIKATVSGISRNYIYGYVYMTPETYQQKVKTRPVYKTIYGLTDGEQDIHELSTQIMDIGQVASVNINMDFKERFDSMMVSMDYIVLLVIVSAGCLAFIVLYNLTNINITERIREIATIKVLGFYPMETATYIFRENLMLTAIGGVVGLVLGYFLHQFIMYNIDVNAVAFDVKVMPISYAYSFLLTFVFAMFVNVLMFFKLKKVNMAESLKSIE